MRSALVGAILALAACKPASGPIVDAEAGTAILEAGAPIVSGVCSLIEGVDTSGVVATICATVEEVISAVAFVLTLRTTPDAGVVKCETLPGTTFCATSSERAKAVGFIVRVRYARLMVDGGGAR